MIMHAVQTGTPFVYEIFRIDYCLRGKCTSGKYFLFKWSTRLQSMYTHMVGRTTSVISPFYSLLPDCTMQYRGRKFQTMLMFQTWHWLLLTSTNSSCAEREEISFIYNIYIYINFLLSTTRTTNYNVSFSKFKTLSDCLFSIETHTISETIQGFPFSQLLKQSIFLKNIQQFRTKCTFLHF